jgi:hypothetical protein
MIMKSGAQKQAKAARMAQIEEEGLQRLVVTRLTSRNQQWVHTTRDGSPVYQMCWNDISVFEPAKVQKKSWMFWYGQGFMGLS